ncbi:hypothetical protein LOK49_LG03G02099 [Camellia lanceoleosa]|uniref:Uncharacterized protein n=1 Tax=Camellia lanceoleosa TaxID=1840588 RepID=A0ACC0IGU3_9ERIC|nr:hypothetical protein LOK49_LG03G02099 [Camellia lanceoleosa]
MYEPQPQPQPHYLRSRRSRSRTNVASCIVASVFLLFLAAVAAVVFFLLFKPKDPTISVDALQFPSFSVSNSTFNFTLFQFVSVTNPNRDDFTHYDSSPAPLLRLPSRRRLHPRRPDRRRPHSAHVRQIRRQGVSFRGEVRPSVGGGGEWWSGGADDGGRDEDEVGGEG